MLGGRTARMDKLKTYNSVIKMLPGFLASVRVRCGKPNCRCARGERHAAHYHVTYRGGVRVRQYVRRDDVAEIREACKANKTQRAQLRAGRG
jgi:Family of unknown function (DUF6788)